MEFRCSYLTDMQEEIVRYKRIYACSSPDNDRTIEIVVSFAVIFWYQLVQYDLIFMRYLRDLFLWCRKASIEYLPFFQSSGNLNDIDRFPENIFKLA